MTAVVAPPSSLRTELGGEIFCCLLVVVFFSATFLSVSKQTAPFGPQEGCKGTDLHRAGEEPLETSRSISSRPWKSSSLTNESDAASSALAFFVFFVPHDLPVFFDFFSSDVGVDGFCSASSISLLDCVGRAAPPRATWTHATVSTMDDDAFPPSVTAVVSDDDLKGSSCSEIFDDWCSKSFAETGFAAATLLAAGSAFVVVVVVVFLACVFASDEEFE